MAIDDTEQPERTDKALLMDRIDNVLMPLSAAYDLVDRYRLTEDEAVALVQLDGEDVCHSTIGSVREQRERIRMITDAVQVLDRRLADPALVAHVLRSESHFVNKHYPDFAGQTLLQIAEHPDGPKIIRQAAHRHGDCEPQQRGDYLRDRDQDQAS